MQKKWLLRWILSLLFLGNTWAESVLVSAFGYTVDLPPGWSVLDAKDPNLISFSDQSRKAVFQIAVFPKDSFSTAHEILQFAKDTFKTRGDAASFLFNGRTASFADYMFLAGKYKARGYFVGIQGESLNYLLIAFASEPAYDEYHDVLLSLLDSFSPGEESRRAPGPISQFYREFPDPQPVQKEIRLQSTTIPLEIGSGEIEANSVVIEREARILTRYTQNPTLFPEAWKRYYQVVYRDTYLRLKPLADTLLTHLLKKGASRNQLPAILLSWIQGFSYSRKSTLSDLASPLEVAVTASGDCDARALLYVAILRHWGFDSILLVSHTYQHALAAVDQPGQGARFLFEGKGYLVAELTDTVPLGLINKKMADPSQWIAIPFHGNIQP
ncbi:MAG: hypothetical protein N2442_13505 [Spirochaetes bacterium]|nr:hypothetical protein [Spirochaetota bacterium]